MRRIITLIYLFSFGLLTACSSGDDNDVEAEVEAELTTLIQQLGLTGDPTTGRDLPSLDAPLVELGKLLFFSKGLSGNSENDAFDTACASCHHPVFAGGDNLSLPYGTGAEDAELVGPGREFEGSDDAPIVGRNAISLINVGLWDRALNHDGSVESLNATPLENGADGSITTPDTEDRLPDENAGDNLVTAQTRLALASPNWMRNHQVEDEDTDTDAVLAHLIDRLRGTNNALENNQWLEQFQIAFDSPDGSAEELITAENLVTALAEYQRSLVFVISPWRDYIAGNTDAISLDAKRGAILALTEASTEGFGCVACHSGDFFTDERYHILAVPQVGPGMGDDNGITTSDDFGRFRVTGAESDKYAFRTPTLLNVERTGPWGHNGAYTSLSAMLLHHLAPESRTADYDSQQIDPNISAVDMEDNVALAIEALQEQRENGETQLELFSTTETEINLLIEFLKTLTDYRLQIIEGSDRHIDCVSPWIPDSRDINPDNLRLNAEDEEGALLIGNINSCA